MKGSCSALVSRFFFGGVFDAGRRSGINRETVIKGRNHGGGGDGEGSGEGNEREWVSCENLGRFILRALASCCGLDREAVLCN